MNPVYNILSVLIINLFFALCIYDVTRQPEELLQLTGWRKELPGPLFLLMNLGISHLILSAGSFRIPLALFFAFTYFTGLFLLLVIYAASFLRWSAAGFILWAAARIFAAGNGSAALIYYTTGMTAAAVVSFLPLAFLILQCIVDVTREDSSADETD